MARVTPAEVKEILNVSYDLQPYIDLAHIFINKSVEPRCDYSEDELKSLELWVSAHFAFMSSPDSPGGGAIKSKSEGQLSVSYAGVFGKNFEGSPYGQNALIFDRCGILPQLGKQRAMVRLA